MKLTDTECRKAQPKEKRYRLSDENGLSLLVTPAGQKYWNVRYTVHGQRQSESLGPYFKEVAEDWFENQRQTRYGSISIELELRQKINLYVMQSSSI
ncbi:DUF4102 domain-containing protein [Acinetobacter sp. ASP199]|nr:Arm DNA-binding domain-containing protein [Acinetobacter sp. ASP199]UNT59891.1 DUF4102 domain-containing protein [Acinetobacter sp. ASP199]